MMVFSFYMFAITAILAGLCTVMARNPVHSVLWLILAFLSSAGLFVLLGAEFVAMLLVIVYVGAVAVLFLFVVMMLDIDFAALKGEMARAMPLGLLIGVVLLMQVAIGVGVWQVVDGYFRSPVAWVDLSVFSGSSSSMRVPMPGGALLGLGLLVNLVAAHVVRFGATRRKAGILAIHAGLIVLLAGEFVTGAASREGLMRIDEGGSASFLEDVRRVELAVVDASDPAFDRVDRKSVV